MRIVIIADSIDLQRAGIHIYTRQMIESLERIGRHEIICIRHGMRNNIKFMNDVLVKGYFPFLKKDPSRVFITIPRAIKKLKPDIVIEPAHFGPFNLPKSIKRVTIIHDLTPVLFPQWHTALSSKLQKLFLPNIIKKANLIITNSKHTLNDLNEYYPISIGKSYFIYPGVNPFFKINESEIKHKKDPFLLTAGTIEPRKNLSTLLKAYKRFRDQSEKKIDLIICGGKGWKNKELYKYIEMHPYKNDIKLKGFVSNEELKKFYLKTSAFIFPSMYEGFGFPVAEAMSCGAPCIVSKSSSLTEVGGDLVKYFNPKSPDELVLKMLEITTSNSVLQETIISGIKHSSKFNWNSFADHLEKYLLHA